MQFESVLTCPKCAHQSLPRRPAGVPQGGYEARSHPPPTAQSQMKGIGDMMGGGGHDPNLKSLDPARQVKTITCCRDTYRVTTADGKTQAFWEHNLRFMTDASKDGPEKNAPAIMPAGMMGDHGAVIFSALEEIEKFAERRCRTSP